MWPKCDSPYKPHLKQRPWAPASTRELARLPACIHQPRPGPSSQSGGGPPSPCLISIFDPGNLCLNFIKCRSLVCMGRSPRALPLGSVSPRFCSSCGPSKTWPAPLTSGFGLVSTMVGPQNPSQIPLPTQMVLAHTGHLTAEK